MTEGERAILAATAEELLTTAPALAAALADGPELLRRRGVSPAALDELVAALPPVTWRVRMRRRLQPRVPRLTDPPEPLG